MVCCQESENFEEDNKIAYVGTCAVGRYPGPPAQLLLVQEPDERRGTPADSARRSPVIRKTSDPAAPSPAPNISEHLTSFCSSLKSRKERSPRKASEGTSVPPHRAQSREIPSGPHDRLPPGMRLCQTHPPAQSAPKVEAPYCPCRTWLLPECFLEFLSLP